VKIFLVGAERAGLGGQDSGGRAAVCVECREDGDEACITPGRRVRKWNLPSRRTWMRPAVSSSLMWCESVAARWAGRAGLGAAQWTASLGDALEQLKAARIGQA